jgi:uncharacterized protein with HEPN domain
MPRSLEVFFQDILEASSKIDRYVETLSLETFRQDERTVDAVIRNLEVIGEATKKIPESVRSANPGVEWKQIAGLRDLLIHEYFGIDLEIVWDIVEKHVPVYAREIRRILEKTSDAE